MKAQISSNFIEDIQILRALAVIFTILQHLWILAPNYGLYRRLVSTVNFWGGVDLFFVVSGFVIGRELLILAEASQPISDFWLHMRSFWVRRAFRILPTAWLWIAIALALSLTFNATGAWGAFTDNLGEGISAILQCANFRHHQILNSAAHFGSLSHYWSLSLEEQFYLLMPFLIFFAAGRLTFILITLTLVQFLLPRGVGDWLWDFRSDALMIGVLITLGRRKSSYLLFRPNFLENGWISLAFVATAMLCLAALAGTMSVTPLYTGMIAVVSGVMVFAASFNQNYFVPPEPCRSALLWVGSRSYGLYIVHPIMFIITKELFFRLWSLDNLKNGKLIAIMAAGLGLSALAAEINFRFIEAPWRSKGRALSSALEQNVSKIGV